MNSDEVEFYFSGARFYHRTKFYHNLQKFVNSRFFDEATLFYRSYEKSSVSWKIIINSLGILDIPLPPCILLNKRYLPYFKMSRRHLILDGNEVLELQLDSKEVNEFKNEYPILTREFIAETLHTDGDGADHIFNNFSKLFSKLMEKYAQLEIMIGGEMSRMRDEIILGEGTGNSDENVLTRVINAFERLEEARIIIYENRSSVESDQFYILDGRYNFILRSIGKESEQIVEALRSFYKYFETDFNKAIESSTLVVAPDPVSYEHIINYYYKCQSSQPHCFNYETIINYCTKKESTNNCFICPYCKSQFDKNLYKQPKILFDLKDELFEKLILDGNGEDYDPDRMKEVLELIRVLNKIDTESIRNETKYYKEKLRNENSAV